MQCPNCKSELEEDSLYCHECGIELLTCSKQGCGFIGLKKHCAACGGTMVSRRSIPTNAPERNHSEAVPKMEFEPKPLPETTTQPHSTECLEGGTQRLGLRLKTLGIRIEKTLQTLQLHSGDILGRRDGPHSAVFMAASAYVSGKHATVTQAGVSWLFTDLGASNGSFVNGVQCSPHQSVPIKKGDVLMLGDLIISVLE